MAQRDAAVRAAWERFGQLARDARVRRGWLQEDLADAAGVSVPAISKIERGIAARTLRPTAVALKVAAALAWLPGSVDNVLAGRDPIVLPGEPTPPPPMEEVRETLDDVIRSIERLDLPRSAKRMLIAQLEAIKADEAGWQR